MNLKKPAILLQLRDSIPTFDKNAYGTQKPFKLIGNTMQAISPRLTEIKELSNNANSATEDFDSENSAAFA